jgi:AbrB family looped-hinge helix DNA binding protein
VAKVTSKLQVTIPKAVATAHGITPGTEIQFESAGDTIRVRVVGRRRPQPTIQDRLRSFDSATARQRERDKKFRRAYPELLEAKDRGWRREDLYVRGIPG